MVKLLRIPKADILRDDVGKAYVVDIFFDEPLDGLQVVYYDDSTKVEVYQDGELVYLNYLTKFKK